jgi:excisionase family DNA binding protein
MDSQLLTIDEVSEVLKIPKSSLYEHTRKGSRDRIPALKIGKHLRFVLEDVLAWGRKKYGKN